MPACCLAPTDRSYGRLVPTIKRLEAHDVRYAKATRMKIRLALQDAVIEFIDENGAGPGVRLRKRQNKKAWDLRTTKS